MTLNKAAEFCVALSQNPDLKKTYCTMPEGFVRQVRQGYEKHFIDAALVSDTAYSGKGTSTQDYFRIELRDCIPSKDSVSFKLKVSGIMNYKTGEMRALKAGATKAEGEAWLKGMISSRVCVTREDVAEGIISESDYNLLEEYAVWWEGIVQEKGQSAPYKLYAKNRLWLVASNEAFKFQFHFELRNNPDPGPDDLEVVLGITDIEWSNAHFTNTTPGVGVARIGKAGGVGQGQAVSIPASTRSFAPQQIEEPSAQTIPSADRGGSTGDKVPF